MRKRLFEGKSNKEIMSILLFSSCFIIMAILAILRFCGIGYFTNEYKEHKMIPIAQELILFVLKWIELLMILATLSPAKWYIVMPVSFIYTNIYWFVPNSTVSFVIDVAYYVFIPFFVNKFDYKRITYGIILIIVVSTYQWLMMIGRYQIDLEAKFNYIAMIDSVLDYKLFILSIYLLINTRRISQNERGKNGNSDT